MVTKIVSTITYDTLTSFLQGFKVCLVYYKVLGWREKVLIIMDDINFAWYMHTLKVNQITII